MATYQNGNHIYYKKKNCKLCLDKCIGCSSYTGNCQACVGNHREAPHCFCETGYYSTDSTFVDDCLQCDNSCLTCAQNGSDTGCESCEASKYLHQGKCLGACPDTFSDYSNIGVCEACESTCKTCSGPLAKDCVDCPDGNYKY
jgi:hypothetical protein